MNDQKCVRCNISLKHLGNRKFHQGARMGVFGDLGEMLVDREEFAMYLCEQCGEISFFVPGYQEQKIVEALTEEYEDYKQHPLYKKYVKEDPARKHFSKSSQLIGFVRWIELQNDGG